MSRMSVRHDRHDLPNAAALEAAGSRAFASPVCVKAKAKKQPLV